MRDLYWHTALTILTKLLHNISAVCACKTLISVWIFHIRSVSSMLLYGLAYLCARQSHTMCEMVDCFRNNLRLKEGKWFIFHVSILLGKCCGDNSYCPTWDCPVGHRIFYRQIEKLDRTDVPLHTYTVYIYIYIYIQMYVYIFHIYWCINIYIWSGRYKKLHSVVNIYVSFSAKH